MFLNFDKVGHTNCYSAFVVLCSIYVYVRDEPTTWLDAMPPETVTFGRSFTNSTVEPRLPFFPVVATAGVFEFVFGIQRKGSVVPAKNDVKRIWPALVPTQH